MPVIKLATCLLAPLVLFASVARGAEPTFSPPLYAFQNGVSFGSLEQEVKTLKAMGYAGVCSTNLNNLKERIAAYEAEGLKLLSIYVSLGDKRIAPAIPLLKDRNAIIELTVRKKIDDAAIQIHENDLIRREVFVRDAAGLDRDMTGFAVDPADVAPGERDQAGVLQLDIRGADFFSE